MTQLFPDMPLPGDEIPPGLRTSGVMPGLNDSLIHILRNFEPGVEGVCEVEQKLQLGLQVPEWSRWSYSIAGATSSMAAAETIPLIFVTVPFDERWWLEYVRLTRASGDNTVQQIRVNAPADYGEGDLATPVVVLTTDTTAIFWPDQGSLQTVTDRVDMPREGYLMEPGSSIAVAPDGKGVAATIYNYFTLVKKSKIVRVLTPAN